MNCRCGKLHITKRKKGELKGLFICPSCGRCAGPRPLYEAIRRNIPLDLWISIHNTMIDTNARTKVQQQLIERTMIEEYHAQAN